MKQQIKNWKNDKIIYECEAETLKIAVEQAVKEKVSLSCADLSSADLCDADLSGADLSRANLRGANLREADLCEADLCGANLSGAELSNADLQHIKFGNLILDDHNQKKYKVEKLNTKILEKIKDGRGLDMEKWHTCETVHCLAGWAINLCENGKELEKEMGSLNAGIIIFHCSTQMVPNFYTNNEKALEDLKKRAELE